MVCLENLGKTPPQEGSWGSWGRDGLDAEPERVVVAEIGVDPQQMRNAGGRTIGRLGRFAGPKHHMSLDVYLRMPGVRKVLKGTGVFVRENGTNVELTQEQVRERFPDAEFVVAERDADDVVFRANITHNLGGMAYEARLYKPLWRPEEDGITKARDLRGVLRRGLHTLLTEPDRLKKLNPKNGWGDYNGLVKFVREYLDACIEYPDADVEVSR